MKVLVTGATGYLGSHLISRLVRQGDEVRALVRNTSKTNQLLQYGVDIVYGDLKDSETLQRAIEGMDIVYHAGAATSGSWQEYEESTIKGTERLLELSMQAGVKRFVHISSVVVYQVYGLAENTLVDENYPLEKAPENVGPYTYSKVEAEKLVLRFHQKGLPAVIVRPGLIYGCRDIILPSIGYFLRDWLFVMIGKGDNWLPLTYIENTVDAILLAGSKKEALGQAYNIVDDDAITQRDYLRRFKSITCRKFLTVPVPFSLLLFLITLVEQARRLGLLNKATRPSKYGLVSKWNTLRFDASKAKKDLNWQPKVSFEEGSRTFVLVQEMQQTA
jgi:nucleoside-diphosphate-sugar epimerase